MMGSTGERIFMGHKTVTRQYTLELLSGRRKGDGRDLYMAAVDGAGAAAQRAASINCRGGRRGASGAGAVDSIAAKTASDHGFAGWK
jgi:hypothetical protein